MNIIQDQSPNYSTDRAGKTINTIVLHSTYGSYLGSVAWLKNPASKVSSHYIISREGEIRKLVSESNTAWHAGNFSVNQESIGIETTDNKQKDITQKAKDALIWLVADIKSRYNIQNIKFHREIVPTACPYLNIDKAWFNILPNTMEISKELYESLVEGATNWKETALYLHVESMGAKQYEKAIAKIKTLEKSLRGWDIKLSESSKLVKQLEYEVERLESDRTRALDALEESGKKIISLNESLLKAQEQIDKLSEKPEPKPETPYERLFNECVTDKEKLENEYSQNFVKKSNHKGIARIQEILSTLI